MARSIKKGVDSEQRFTSDHPCPVCEGHQGATGDDRCYGYASSDGRYAYCTNVEGVLDFNENADAWPHLIEEHNESASRNGQPDRAHGNVGARVTLATLTREKGLPTEAFTSPGCRETTTGVAFGGKERRTSPKYLWVDGRSPTSDPLWPMPGATVEAAAYITAGETDCVTARHAGLTAFAITSGEKTGKSSLTTAHYRDLMKRGLEHVTIAGDADEHGLAWMKNEAAAAQSAGLKVSIIDLSPLYDHFHTGVKDLNELWLSVGCERDAFLETLDAHTREHKQVRISTIAELRVLATSEVPYLVESFLSPGEKMGLTGPPKNNKTWIALNLAHAVATGNRFLNRPEWECKTPRPVVLIEEEGDPVKLAQRVERAFRDVEDAPFYLIQKMGFSLLNPGQVDWLIERLQEREAGLLILDPWQRMIVGADEDKAKDTAPAWDEVHRITLEVPDCAVLILHHANKAGGLGLNAIRGSSRFAGEVDLSMIVKVDEPGVIHASLEGRDLPKHLFDEGVLEVRYPLDDPFALNATGFTVNVSSVGRPKKEAEVLALFQTNPSDEFSKADVSKRTGMSESTSGAHVNTLVSRGVLEGIGRKYRLKQGEDV